MPYTDPEKQKAATARWASNNRSRTRANNRKYYERNKEDVKARVREYKREVWEEIRDAKYGLAPGQYDRMLIEQDGLCGICGEPPQEKALAVDHDHVTGEVRGLLCENCNLLIGLSGDDPEVLKNATHYLKQHGK